MSDKSRRKLITLVVEHLLEYKKIVGRQILSSEKCKYAEIIIELFPNLKNPYSECGYVSENTINIFHYAMLIQTNGFIELDSFVFLMLIGVRNIHVSLHHNFYFTCRTIFIIQKLVLDTLHPNYRILEDETQKKFHRVSRIEMIIH